MHAAARRALIAGSLLVAAAGPPPEPTIVGDPATLQRLRANSGMTVQWISWDKEKRGQVVVTTEAGVVHLSGSQQDGTSSGRVTLEGDVLAIDTHSFTLVGHVVITDTPDVGRRCVYDGTLTFVAAGRRQYWRMHPMDACPNATDYVDIYFPDPTDAPVIAPGHG